MLMVLQDAFHLLSKVTADGSRSSGPPRHAPAIALDSRSGNPRTRAVPAAYSPVFHEHVDPKAICDPALGLWRDNVLMEKASSMESMPPQTVGRFPMPVRSGDVDVERVLTSEYMGVRGYVGRFTTRSLRRHRPTRRRATSVPGRGKKKLFTYSPGMP
jgi:hypothetical protein